MPPGLVGVPGVLHCFTPAVAASALGSGLGLGLICYSIENIGIAVGQPGNVAEKTQKTEPRNVCLFVTEEKKGA